MGIEAPIGIRIHVACDWIIIGGFIYSNAEYPNFHGSNCQPYC